MKASQNSPPASPSLDIPWDGMGTRPGDVHGTAIPNLKFKKK